MASEIIVRIKSEGSQKFIKELKSAGIAVEETGKKTKKAQSQISGLVGRISKDLKKFAGGIAAAFTTAQIVKFANDSVKAFREFDASLKELQAITGLSGQSLDDLAVSAKRLSAESTKSSSEVLEAFKLIGSAKPELLSNVDALTDLTSAAITLSEASGLTLPEAATNLGNSLNALQLPASEAGRLINVLAAASQQGAKEVPFVADALSKFGGIAAQAGVGVETAVAAVETLGKAIPEASIVGTNLRGILIKLQVAASSSGREFMGLQKELELLADDVDDVTKLTRIFGQENLLAAQTLISQRNEMADLEAAITATNTAYEQQAIINESAQATLLKFNNAINELKVNIGAGLANALQPFLKDATTFINRLNDSRSAAQQTRDEFVKQNEQFRQQTEALDQLVPSYEELTEKAEAAGGAANLNADEQERLKLVTEAIVKIVPDAATEWDEYGNALKLATTRIGEWTEAQKFALRSLNVKAINRATTDYNKLEKQLKQLEAREREVIALRELGVTRVEDSSKKAAAASVREGTSGNNLINTYEEISNVQAKIIRQKQDIADAVKILAESGVDIDAQQQSYLNWAGNLFKVGDGTKELNETQKDLIDRYVEATKRQSELNTEALKYNDTVLKQAEAWEKLQKQGQTVAGSIEALEKVLKDANDALKKVPVDSPTFVKLLEQSERAKADLDIVKKKYEDLQKIVSAGITAETTGEIIRLEIETELEVSQKIDEIKTEIEDLEAEKIQLEIEALFAEGGTDAERLAEAVPPELVRRIQTLKDELKLLDEAFDEVDPEPIEIDVPVTVGETFDSDELVIDTSEVERETTEFWENFEDNAKNAKKSVEDFKNSIFDLIAAGAAAASGFDVNKIFNDIIGLQQLLKDPGTENFEKGFAAAGVALNTFSEFEGAITEKRLARLQAQKEAGEITEKEFARKRAELVRQEAVTQKAIAVSQAIINTALGATAQFQAGPAGIGLAAAVIALGAAQVALILAQPIPPVPGFAEGTKGSKVAPPGAKWVGERGPELIIDAGGYKIINNKDSEAISKILSGYGVPVKYTTTAEDINKPLSELQPLSIQRDGSINWNPLLMSNDQQRATLGRKLDRLHDDLILINRAQRKRKLNARI